MGRTRSDGVNNKYELENNEISLLLIDWRLFTSREMDTTTNTRMYLDEIHFVGFISFRSFRIFLFFTLKLNNFYPDWLSIQSKNIKTKKCFLSSFDRCLFFFFCKSFFSRCSFCVVRWKQTKQNDSMNHSTVRIRDVFRHSYCFVLLFEHVKTI